MLMSNKIIVIFCGYGLLINLLFMTLIECQVTLLDNQPMKLLLRYGRLFLSDFTRHGGDIFEYNLKHDHLQRQFKDDEEFFCDVNGPGARSKKPPTSVHKLRPGDIDIIAAMGDSLTSGNGGMAEHILHITVESKGTSWAIGGKETWRQFLTIPNILKIYNPNLYGYSTDFGLSYQKVSRFNVAAAGSMLRDQPYMAKILIKRLLNDPKVDMKNHWKLITLMVGFNDICSDLCYQASPEKMIDEYEKDLISVIKIIKENVPRTMLNIITAPTLGILDFRGKPMECVSMHHIQCTCLIGTRFSSQRERLLKIYNTWKERQEEIVLREEFQNNPEFTVNLQPFTKHLRFPLNKQQLTDFTYMAPDCFHFNQKGNALAANAYWNNMLEPVGNKSENWITNFTYFKCPTEERPFLATKLNSLK